MSDPDLSPPEARAIVRRHAHDLRNMINCMDLEIACLLEDAASNGAEIPLRKLRDQLALTERTIYSLSVRFREPSVHVAAAADIFYNWRQQMHKLSRADRFEWEEPDCAAAINVDFTAIIAVLVDLCLEVKTPPGSPLSTAALRTEGSSVVFSLREPPFENPCPVDAQQWREWERLAVISGGHLERSGEELPAPRLTRLIFPAV